MVVRAPIVVPEPVRPLMLKVDVPLTVTAPVEESDPPVERESVPALIVVPES